MGWGGGGWQAGSGEAHVTAILLPFDERHLAIEPGPYPTPHLHIHPQRGRSSGEWGGEQELCGCFIGGDAEPRAEEELPCLLGPVT